MSVSGRRLIQTQGGTRTEQQPGTDADRLAAYRDHFRIMLSRVPDTRQRSRTVGPRSLTGPRRAVLSPEMIAPAG